MNKAVVALVYDFDGTLIAGNMQEYGFIEAIGETPETFWKEVNDFSKKHKFDDQVLAYMHCMVKAAAKENISIKAEDFEKKGKDIHFFKGVKEWFKRLEKKWSKHFELQHYIISSGVQEMIEGCAISTYFKKIYACKFLYHEIYHYPIWPGRVVNFTTKTQYLFRINKGTDDVKKLNKYQKEEKRPIPFRRMLYFGDGHTDIPCMRLVKEGKGHVFALYDPDSDSLDAKKKAAFEAKKKVASELVKDGRAHVALSADYSSGSALDEAVEKVLDLLRAELTLKASFGKR